jgi:hypothetical protein
VAESRGPTTQRGRPHGRPPWGPLEGITVEFSGTRPDGSTFRQVAATNGAGEVSFSTDVGEQGGYLSYTSRFPGLGNVSTTRSFEVIEGDMTECVSDDGGPCF